MTRLQQNRLKDPAGPRLYSFLFPFAHSVIHSYVKIKTKKQTKKKNKTKKKHSVGNLSLTFYDNCVAFVAMRFIYAKFS